MAVKVLLMWDILPDREREYFEFVVGEFVPGIQRLGFQASEAWATIYGPYPQIQVGMLASDTASARRILNSSGWKSLHKQLSTFVTNFSYKIVPARGGFQF
ncbi:MAG: hypothetical protein ACUVRJ_10650 [Candidatus Villigracilaceae bacterium]